MKCPVDATDLMMTERQGIEIDYCPKCRGVWLDRGELDKIIDRSANDIAPPPPPPREARPWPDDRREREYQRPYHKKRKSILGEIFDF